MSQLVLGTVQFGLNYGISNTKGKVSYKEVCRILDYVAEKKIRYLDTANAYGESEKVIGKYLKEHNNENEFSIITKIRNIPSGLSISEVESRFKQSFNESLDNLRVNDLDTVLLHNSSNLHEYPYILELLEELKRRKLVKKIGISGYSVSDDSSFHSKIDAVQYPGNLFDHQVVDIQPNIEIYIRSVFLQGLFFLNEKYIQERNPLALPYIKKLWNIQQKSKLSVERLALGFVKKMRKKASILIGVENIEQLKKNFSLFNHCEISDELYSEIFNSLSHTPEEVINPSLWKKK